MTLNKLINNSSISNKGNYDHVTVFGYLTLISRDFYDFFFFVFSPVLVSIKKIRQTLKTLFDHICKHPKILRRPIFNSFLGV